MRGMTVLVGLCAILASGLEAQEPVVYRIPISGTIENGLAPYVARALKAAAAAGAVAAVLDIDTPGGRVDAAERILGDAGRHFARAALAAEGLGVPAVGAVAAAAGRSVRELRQAFHRAQVVGNELGGLFGAKCFRCGKCSHGEPRS